MKEFWLCFIPIFVAVDALGVLPLFICFTRGLEHVKVRRIIIQSVITASATSILFIFFGKALLNIMGITISDFMISGGLLLFAIAVSNLLSFEKKKQYV